MFPSYLKIALRTLATKKGPLILNTLGLIIGITSCLLIFQYVSYERSYDTFEPSSIYRLRLDRYEQGKLEWKSATAYPAIGPALLKNYPEVENMCRLYNWVGLFANPETGAKFKETKGYCADASALSMLGIQLLEGDPAKALSDPYQLVISQTMAKKYFGTEHVLGKQLIGRYSNPGDVTYVISGVFKDYPANAHLTIQYLTSYPTLGAFMRTFGLTDATNTSFKWHDFYVYLKLKAGTDPAAFAAKLPSFCAEYLHPQQDELHLIPLSDIHLYSNNREEAEANGNGQEVAFLFLIGLFILGIAWINYINLSTARSVERAKEVGVRKVMGAVRSDLIRQFMAEGLLLNLFALLLSLEAAYFLAPAFNGLLGRTTDLGFHMTGRYWLVLGVVLLIGTTLSALYPAIVLSEYKPIGVLKGVFKGTASGLWLRKGLTVFQFSVSVILIAATIIVYQQVDFMRSRKLGADISQTLVLDGAQSVPDSAYPATFGAFRSELLTLPGVKGVTASTSVMGQEIEWTRTIKALTSPGDITMHLLGVDYNFVPQFGIHLLAGRNFSGDFPADGQGQSALLNEAGARALNFARPEDALGKRILATAHIGAAPDTFSVVGVVGDVHQVGLKNPIEPQVLVFRSGTRNNYSLKLENGASEMAVIEKAWNKYFPGDPFSYFFLDDFYNQQYKSDRQFGQIFTLFSFLAILIACFGLMGLSAYNVLQRTKEIGIRKVLGASKQYLVYILLKDSLRMMALGLLLAIPVTWWVMHAWLQDYAYRIDISGFVFVIAGAISIGMALLSMSFYIIRATLASPVTSLRANE
jgi:putative ABC transport system permease protein